MNYYMDCKFRNESPIDSLLDKDDCTLEILLDEPDVLQECKSQNPRLIDFLIDPVHLEQLVKYVAVIPEADCDEAHKKKYPLICCDILCAEIWTITEALLANHSLLKLICNFLETDPSDINPTQAKITHDCARVLCSLLMVKLEEVVAFLRTIPHCVDKLVNHISNPNVVDIILKLISLDGPLMVGAGPITWLCEEGLVERLVEKYVSADEDWEMQEHIVQTFQELISYAAYSTSDFQSTPEIIKRLESEQVAQSLFSLVLESKHESAVLNSLKILSALVQRSRALIYEEELDPKKIPGVVTVAVSKFPECKVFLNEKCFCSTPQVTTFGVLDPPFGRVRQAMLELIEASLRTNNSFVFNSFLSSGIMSTLLDLFFKYKWNNFLHQSVFSIMSMILQSPNERAVRHLIEGCRLIDRILQAETENEVYSLSSNVAYGYVAFLTRLSLLIDGIVQHHPFVREILCSHSDWQLYVTNVLAPRNSHENRLLGGGLRYPAESTDDDDVGDLNRGGDFGDWFYERPSEDDENGEETLELIQSDGGYEEDDVPEVLRYSDSDGSSDSDDETIVKRDLAFDDSDNEDPFPATTDSSMKE